MARECVICSKFVVFALIETAFIRMRTSQFKVRSKIDRDSCAETTHRFRIEAAHTTGTDRTFHVVLNVCCYADGAAFEAHAVAVRLARHTACTRSPRSFRRLMSRWILAAARS